MFLQKIESHLKNREFSSMHSVKEFTMFVQYIHCLRSVLMNYTDERNRQKEAYNCNNLQGRAAVTIKSVFVLCNVAVCRCAMK